MKRPTVHECIMDKGAHFTIEFEARPVIPAVKIESLTLHRVKATPVTEQDQQNALQNLLLQFANYEPIQAAQCKKATLSTSM